MVPVLCEAVSTKHQFKEKPGHWRVTVCVSYGGPRCIGTRQASNSSGLQSVAARWDSRIRHQIPRMRCYSEDLSGWLEYLKLACLYGRVPDSARKDTSNGLRDVSGVTASAWTINKEAAVRGQRVTQGSMEDIVFFVN